MRVQTVKAEEEYGSITQNFKNIQNQSKLQDDVLDRTINEINRTKDTNASLSLNLIEKNTEITGLKNVLQVQEEKLSSAEAKIKCIAEQLLSVISPSSNENLEVFLLNLYLINCLMNFLKLIENLFFHKAQ